MSQQSRTDGVCAVHGEYPVDRHSNGLLKGWSQWCPTCLAEQQARREAQAEADQRAHQARQKESRKMGRLNSCGAEGRYRHATFESFRATTDAHRRAVKACTTFCETFARDSGNTLFLIGPPGTGKTHLLSAMVKRVIEDHDCAAELVTGPGLIRRVRATWSKREQTEEQVLDDLAELSLLAIDEIGLAAPTESELRILFEVIDGRYVRGRPTLIASNLTLPMLAELLGERIFDRLAENHRAVVMQWPSYRTTARPA